LCGARNWRQSVRVQRKKAAAIATAAWSKKVLEKNPKVGAARNKKT